MPFHESLGESASTSSNFFIHLWQATVLIPLVEDDFRRRHACRQPISVPSQVERQHSNRETGH
jgi:hypothetical protein